MPENEKKYKVFFGCSVMEAAGCSEPFESVEAAREHMYDAARRLAESLGVDTNSRFFQLHPMSYTVITGSGAMYSGCLLPVEDNEQGSNPRK